MIKKYIVPVVALLGGIIFIVLGFMGISQAKRFPEVKATVEKVESDYTTDADGITSETLTVYVKYRVNNKEYTEILQDANGKIREGDVLTVRYNPEKPTYVTATTKTGGIVRIAFGAVVLACGVVITKKTVSTGKGKA